MLPYSPYPAGLLRRLAAAVYDLFLLLALWLLATLILLPFHQGHAVQGDNLWYRLYLLYLPFVFFGWFWVHGGQTLGMRAWRMQVRTASGKPLGWGHAVLRYLGAWVGWLSIAGVLWIVFDARKRTLQDVVSGTEIVVLPHSR